MAKNSVIVYKDEITKINDKKEFYEDWTLAPSIAFDKGMPRDVKYYSEPSPSSDSIKFEWETL